jgi:hypothetical protein
MYYGGPYYCSSYDIFKHDDAEVYNAFYAHNVDSEAERAFVGPQPQQDVKNEDSLEFNRNAAAVALGVMILFILSRMRFTVEPPDGSNTNSGNDYPPKYYN